ncbi:MAG: histidine kinase [Gordonia sp. (in: high G+C Gram-positive bacteria)]
MWSTTVSRVRPSDVGLTAVFVAIGAALIADGLATISVTSPVTALPSWFPAITLAPAAACQLLRSAHPAIALAGVVAALVIDVITVPSIPVWLVFSDIVYAVCVYGSPRLLRVLHGVCVLIGVATLTLVLAYTESMSWRELFIVLLWLIAVVVSPLAYGQAVREHRNALAIERAHSAALATLADRERAEAVAAERARLARELHDVIAGRLSGIAVQSAAALEYPDNPPLALRALRAVRAASVDALTEMRDMIELLSAGADADPPGRETAGLRRLDRLTRPIAESRTPLYIDCPAWISDADTVDAIAPIVDIAAYRIVAESLANAVTHAPGQPITVSIAHDGRALRIVVRNLLAHEGDSDRTGHCGRGIENMRTRARAVGGRLGIVREAHAFEVTAVLPAPVNIDSAPEVSR